MEACNRRGVLGPSPTGNINDKGPSFPWVIRQEDGTWLMYYVTWGSWAPPDELSNRTGLAISNDEGIHWKVLKEPLLPLGTQGEHDAGVTGSVAVLQIGLQTYQMWYTAGERYAILDWISPGFKRGIVHIGHAVSRDGIEWVKTRKPVLLHGWLLANPTKPWCPNQPSIGSTARITCG
jgi:hypothetical protein